MSIAELHSNSISNQSISGHGISREAEACALRTARKGRQAINQRLEELDGEWAIEDMLKLQAVAFIVKYAVFGHIVSRKFYWIPALVGAFTVEQAITGWSPPYALYRKAGKRSREEIENERRALQYIRGDFG